jgi:hypothetical protein
VDLVVLVADEVPGLLVAVVGEDDPVVAVEDGVEQGVTQVGALALVAGPAHRVGVVGRGHLGEEPQPGGALQPGRQGRAQGLVQQGGTQPAQLGVLGHDREEGVPEGGAALRGRSS